MDSPAIAVRENLEFAPGSSSHGVRGRIQDDGVDIRGPVRRAQLSPPPSYSPAPTEPMIRDDIIYISSDEEDPEEDPEEGSSEGQEQEDVGSGDAIVVRGVHDVGTNAARQDKLETKIDSLTTLITQLAMNQQKYSMARVCGICTSTGHYSDVCPSLLETRTGDRYVAYDANIYNNRPPHQHQHYDPPSSSTYNPSWRNQAPFENNSRHNRQYVPLPIQQ
ncbi:hypothetical protein Lal_00043647 [Lupinus albus]|nr:hypothetical protein Lal_00043647 [Lupinus albus]